MPYLTKLLPLADFPAPFDAIAGHYDASFTETAAGRLQREQVWAFLAQTLHRSPRSTHVLELNCGTGEDAFWLARQGCQVLATDISLQMLSVTQQKVQAAGLEDRVAVKQLDLTAIERFNFKSPARPGPSAFDLILSNFGGLNCLAPVDLQRIGMYLPALLASGGHFVAVVMGRFCWQESLYFGLKGRWRTALRRLRRGPVAARLDEQTTVPTWYYSPRVFRRFFPELEIVALRPVGFWIPPSYLDTHLRRWPNVLKQLSRLEQMCQARFWAWGADHFLICLKKTGP